MQNPGQGKGGQTRPGLFLLPMLVGAPTSIHLLFHASGDTLELCPHGPFVLHRSIFAWTFAPFTLRRAGAELLRWFLMSCSYSDPDTKGPAVDWSLVAGTADLLRLLGADIHSLFLFPSVHAERRGETSSLEGQNILVPGLRSGREYLAPEEGGGREEGSPATLLRCSYNFSQGKSLPNMPLTCEGPDPSLPHH